MKPKIIAMYLPQFHQIPENDEFWGEGFTDWVTVKNAKPLFKGHNQPRVPLKNNYYDLSIKENVEWQSMLAQKYGIYGFGVYHYWFNNDKNLLTKPADIIRDDPNVDINYFLAWDNANWVRSWSNLNGNAWAPIVDNNFNRNDEPSIMIPYIIGDKEDWENHYVSIRKHFESPKYIKVCGKPVFIIFNYDDTIKEMCHYWNKLAINDGFDGVHFIFRKKDEICIPSEFFQFKYEPLNSGWSHVGYYERIINKASKILKRGNKVKILSYDDVWSQLLRNARKDVLCNHYHGAFVNYDDTPRRGSKGRIIVGGSPEKFGSYISELLNISETQNKSFIFLTAWNEWGEGAFLEPDSDYGYDYLKALGRLLDHLHNYVESVILKS